MPAELFTTFTIAISFLILVVTFLAGAFAGAAWLRRESLQSAPEPHVLRPAARQLLELVSAAVVGHVARIGQVEHRLDALRLTDDRFSDDRLLAAITELRQAVEQLQRDMDAASGEAIVGAAGATLALRGHTASDAREVTDEPLTEQRPEGIRPRRRPTLDAATSATLSMPDPGTVAAFIGSEAPKSNRCAFPYVQRIAPMRNGAAPAPAAFQAVLFRDISTGGFSFYAPQRPASMEIAVALGAEPNLLYFTARVAHVHDASLDDERQYLVGCRFTGRIEL